MLFLVGSNVDNQLVNGSMTETEADLPAKIGSSNKGKASQRGSALRTTGPLLRYYQ